MEGDTPVVLVERRREVEEEEGKRARRSLDFLAQFDYAILPTQPVGSALLRK